MHHLSPSVVKNKNIVVRVDFNVEINDKGEIIDDFRVRRSLKTIEFLKENMAKRIILISHLGQPTPNDFFQKDFSLEPVARYLEKILKTKVYFVSFRNFKELKEKTQEFKNGELIFLENIRFFKEEEKNDKKFAKKISELGDIYINEAFSVSHRQSATISAITKFLPSYPGFLLEEEVTKLKGVIDNPQKPMVVILGGSKIEDKLPLLSNFSEIADYILIGGAIANTVLKAFGFEIGDSFYSPLAVEKIKVIGFKKAELILPGDLMVLSKEGKVEIRDVSAVKKTDKILDIGPVAAKNYKQFIGKAKTIFFNGPMGKVEDRQFREGTKEVLEGILNNKISNSVIGGGDTLKTIKLLKIKEPFQENIFFSTGGGAMLNFLAGQKLPGLVALNFYSS
ncbi:MAG TPA: phosphoglycerate kinase [Candidatus Paceibacterota bacterium]|nr:phosphoglycerate kinase [Candidatus Paceibacterota bacterium]